MIIDNENAFAIMDSLTHGGQVRVYDAREKLLTIGVVKTCFKNGFRVTNLRGYDHKEAETTFFYKDSLTVVNA